MHIRVSLILLLFWGVHTNDARYATADVVLTYEGALFDDIVGEPGFTTTDRITGTFTFDAIGASSVKAFSLSTTVAGSPGFSFSVDDVNAPGMYAISVNDFYSWNGATPDGFSLIVSGEVFGETDGWEEIGVSDIGDYSIFDSAADTESYAFNFIPGSFSQQATSVPEPSGLAVFAAAIAGMFARQRYRDNRKRKTPILKE